MSELAWGPILAGYLFLGGMAGGAFIVAALADLFKGEDYEVISKSGTYVSFVSILVGLVLLILDLKRFEVAPLVILNAYRRFPDSILTVGTWIITGFLVISLLTSVLWLFDGNKLVRKLLDIVGLVLGISTAAYTGLLLSFSRGAPFWNTSLLPWTFVVSGTLTGLAVALLMIPVIAIFMPRPFKEFETLFKDKVRFSNLMGYGQRYIVVLILIELALVIIEMVLGGHMGALLSEFGLSLAFYGYLVLGLLAPLGISYILGKMKAGRNDTSILLFSTGGFVLILVGGFLLRYVVLTAGQIIH